MTGGSGLLMREPARSFLLDVRRGQVSDEERLDQTGELEREIIDLPTASPLQQELDEQRVEQGMLSDRHDRSMPDASARVLTSA